MARKASVHEKAGLLRDSVYAANDGIITTFAVVAGATGAVLTTSVIVVFGLVNLLADGISMASGDYLGVKSEIDYEKAKGNSVNYEGSPVKHSVVTFLSFSIVGFLPLIPYIFKIEPEFILSSVIVVISLFVIGASRGLFTKKNWIKSGLEMLLVGGIAALVAFLVGTLVNNYLL